MNYGCGGNYNNPVKAYDNKPKLTSFIMLLRPLITYTHTRNTYKNNRQNEDLDSHSKNPWKCLSLKSGKLEVYKIAAIYRYYYMQKTKRPTAEAAIVFINYSCNLLHTSFRYLNRFLKLLLQCIFRLKMSALTANAGLH